MNKKVSAFKKKRIRPPPANNEERKKQTNKLMLWKEHLENWCIKLFLIFGYFVT